MGCLNTGVILNNVVSRDVGVPVGASAVDAVNVLEGSDLRLALNDLHSETLISVPRDVAVDEPCTWVIGDETNGGPTVAGKHDNVTTGGVGGGEGGGVVVGAGASAQDPEVVTVEVDGVGLGKVGLDDHGDPLVGSGQRPDVLGVSPGGVALSDGHDGGVVPLGDEGLAVHGPQDGAGGGASGQGSLFVILRDKGADVDSKVRNKVGSVLIGARVIQVVRGGGRILSGGRVVSDNSENVVDIVVVRASLLRNGAHPEVSSRLGGGNNDIVTLAHADGDIRSLVRSDGNKVAGNDLHGVVVDGETEVGISGTVHKTHAVAGAGSEVDLEARTDNGSVVLSPGVGSVDEAVVELVMMLGLASYDAAWVVSRWSDSLQLGVRCWQPPASGRRLSGETNRSRRCDQGPHRSWQ